MHSIIIQATSMIRTCSRLIAFLRRRPKFVAMLLLAPTLFIFVFTLIIPLSSLMVISFYRYSLLELRVLYVQTFTLENYIKLLTDSLYLRYLWDTLEVSAIVTMVSLVMGYPVAYLLARSKSARVRGLVFTVVIITFFTGGMVRVYAWMLLLQDSGVINRTLISLRIITEPMRLMYNEFGVAVALIHWCVPLVILSLFGSIQSINPDLEDAARSLGAADLQVFLRVTLPLSLPGVVTAIILAYAGSVAAFVAPATLGGGVVKFMSNVVYDRMIRTTNYPLGSAAAVVIFSISLAIIYGAQQLLMKKVKAGVE